MIQPLVVKANSNILRIWLEEPRVILWINQGIYALIPIEVIRNELSIQQDRAKLSDSTTHTFFICTFAWNQAIVIPPETGKVLAAQYENKTYQCTNGGNNKGHVETTMKV